MDYLKSKLLFVIGILLFGLGFISTQSTLETPSSKELEATIIDKHQEIRFNPEVAEYVFKFYNDKCVSWNTSKVNPPQKPNASTSIYEQNNRLFLITTTAKSDTLIIGLEPLNNIKTVNNTYFSDIQPTWLDLNDGYYISKEASDNFITEIGETKLYFQKKKNSINKLSNKQLFCFFISILFICLGLINKLDKTGLLLCFVLVISAKLASQFPIISNSELFNPEHLAFNNFYSSLGDFGINNTLILLFALLLNQVLKEKLELIKVELFIAFSFFTAMLIIKLVENSTIPLELNNLLQINGYSIVAIIALWPIFKTQLLLFPKHLEPNKKTLVLITLATIILLIAGHLVGKKDLVVLLWGSATLYLSILTIFLKLPKQWMNFVIVIGFATVSCHLFIKHSQLNHAKKQLIFAEKLATKQDPFLEYILDEYVNSTSVFNSLAEAENHWNQFAKKESYINRFDIETANSIYSVEKSVWHFSDSISQTSYKVFLNTKAGLSYRITLSEKGTSNYLGFPALLQEGESDLRLNNYSYAVFNNNYLEQTNNASFFPTRKNVFNHPSNVHVENYLSNNRSVIVTHKLPSFYDKLSVFSLFTILFLVLFAFQPLQFYRQLNQISTRIRLIVVGVLSGSLLLFALGSWLFIVNQKQDNNHAQLLEKTQSVNTELKHKLGDYASLTPEMSGFIGNYLVKFSNVFFTDITLFNTKGELLASSRPEIFSKGMRNKLIDFHTFKKLNVEQRNGFIQDEQIGSLSYLSSYVKFKNKNNETLAYLNLPYFAKQTALDEELSGFLNAMLNMFLLLLAIALIISIAVSNSVTRPLQQLQTAVSSLDLGNNTPINYPHKNEIGALIERYNIKVSELQDKAIKLAESERNSAWREMAKQVAHEIKNPLTPMKLHLQYLQHKGVTEITNEQFNKTANALILQIDTLAKIADEFAHFAKMPKLQLEFVNIDDLMGDVVATYQGFEPTLAYHNATDIKVKVDKNQLARVLNNVIKNAYQALSNVENPKLEIVVSETTSFIKISVIDNGEGIPDELKTKIFEPKFTTKTDGMGLGLAMCKSMMNNISGLISCKDNNYGGATFEIEIPKID